MKEFLTTMVLIAIIVLFGVLFDGSSESDVVRDSGSDDEESRRSSLRESIEAAFTGNGSIACTFTAGEGQEVQAFVKEGNVRVRAEDGGGRVSHVLHVDDTVYLWDEGGREGISFSTRGSRSFGGSFMSREELEARLEGESADNEANCSVGDISDAHFVVPAEVLFESAFGDSH